MAVFALIFLSILLFLLTGSQGFFKQSGDIVTYMDDSATLAEGSPVRLNGILVGKVKKVALSGLNKPKRIVKIDLQVEQKYFKEIPIDSIAAISAESLLAAKYINIKKGKNQQAIRPGAEIAAQDTSNFDDVIAQGNNLLVSLQSILNKVDGIVSTVEVGKGSIGKLLVDEELYNRVLAIAGEAQVITHALTTKNGTIGKLMNDDELYNQVRGSLTRMDGLLNDIQNGDGTIGKFIKDPALYNDTHQSVLEIRKLLADLNAGKGTAGKLLKSDELHAQILTTISKVDVTIDKINSGQGTIGQLLVNAQLYDSLNGTTREMHELLKDFRANPKKFLRIKLALF